jgi:hypothetical protein
MLSIDPSLLPKRDARGRFLTAPSWLKPGWARIHMAGLALGGALRKRCAFGTCRAVPVRGSDRCQHHDQNWRRRRLKELRAGKGEPMSPRESVRLFRADTQRLWSKAPWFPMATIWLEPRLESAFAADCHNAGLPLSETAIAIGNNLRWIWVRSCLNHNDPAGWSRALAIARRRQTAIGSAPEGYVYTPPPLTPPTDPRVKAVLRRAVAWEPAARNPVVDRSTRAKTRRQQAQERRRSRRKFDLEAFIAEHWPSLRPVFKSLHIDLDDVDAPIGRQLILAWHAVITEQERLGDAAYGPQRKAWQALLRTLKS